MPDAVLPSPEKGRRLLLLRRSVWAGMALACLLYAVFSFQMGYLELLHQVGLGTAARTRATPAPFILHAFSGALGLVLVPLQFASTIRRRAPRVHRIGGRLYVGSIWLASASGAWNAAFFDVSWAAKAVFVAIAAAWFLATTMGFVRIRQGKLQAHREWMVRSAALTLFIITFSLWVPGLEVSPLPHAVAYPLGVFLSGFLNLVAAEAWIRSGRAERHT